MSFVSIWFCIIGTVYVLNVVVNTMIKIYTLFDEEEGMPKEIKNTMYS